MPSAKTRSPGRGGSKSKGKEAETPLALKTDPPRLQGGKHDKSQTVWQEYEIDDDEIGDDSESDNSDDSDESHRASPTPAAKAAQALHSVRGASTLDVDRS